MKRLICRLVGHATTCSMIPLWTGWTQHVHFCDRCQRVVREWLEEPTARFIPVDPGLYLLDQRDLMF